MKRFERILRLSLHTKPCFFSSLYYIFQSDLGSQERVVARDAIVDCYQQVLPQVQRRSAFSTGSSGFRKAKHGVYNLSLAVTQFATVKLLLWK